MITRTARFIATIKNPELRDLAAYALDSVHDWRHMWVSMDECEAVSDAFSGENTRTRAVLQPVVEWSGWYIHGPFDKWIGTLQDWPSDADEPRWRLTKEFLTTNPLKLWPKFRNEYDMVARFAASRTWYSSDGFIANYVAHVAPRLADGNGIPGFFFPDLGADYTDDEMEERWAQAGACHRLTMEVLAQMARDAVEDDEALPEFFHALAECAELGILWD